MKALVFNGDDPDFGQYVDQYKFLQIATITRVDNETNRVDLQFATKNLVVQNVRLSNPFYTGRAFIGGMPEVGSEVICGFLKNTATSGTPIILGYLNNLYKESLEYSLERGYAPEGLDSITGIKDKIGYNISRLKRRKMYPGDVQAESSKGSEVFLDDDVHISDSNLNEITISSNENLIRSNSVNNFVFSSGVKYNAGNILRPHSPYVEPIILPNGQEQRIVTENGNSVDLNGRPFSESRLEIIEISDNSLTPSSHFDHSNFETRSPDNTLLLSQVFGTLVGNDKKDMEKYGRVLRPQIFSTIGNYLPDVRDVVCTQSEYHSLASAFQLSFKSGTKIDIDKEGHVFANIAASTGRHPLGAGRSLELSSAGSWKISVGKNINQQNSIDLFTLGKVDFHIGKDDLSFRSMSLTLERALYINVLNPDKTGTAYSSSFLGNVIEVISGSKSTSITGNYTINVEGLLQENILGSKVENYVNDKMTNYGGDFSQSVIGYLKTSVGGGDAVRQLTDSYTVETTVTTGSHKISTKGLNGNIEEHISTGKKLLTILSGNNEINLTTGSHKINVGGTIEEVSTGSNKETIQIGDKEITIQQGDFNVKITSGKIKITTTNGNIDINSMTQKVTIFGMTSVDVKSGTQVNVNAPSVKLGPSPAQGGIVTGLPVPSHLDYLTGLPLQGSSTVSGSI